jgi:ParB-like chromosome segregation protein Spo0J
VIDECVTVPIKELVRGDSPRTNGEDIDHVRLLASIEAELPPIVVHKATKQVIDGAHRLRAAELRGQRTVRVRYFDGTASDAFVLAVELNCAHGLPLSLSDRTSAAGRIVESHPQWSNRKVAEVTGLAANTVGAIRKRSMVHSAQSERRVGRDGRTRPTDGSEGRRRAGEYMTAKPDASLREVAMAAGISVSTAADVRARLSRGELATTKRQRTGQKPRAVLETTSAGLGTIMHTLRRDPSLRFTDSGRLVLRLLDACAIDENQWENLITQVPAHHQVTIARLARECARIWQTFADRLARHSSRIDHDASATPPGAAG